jgi:hypothetical protein
MGASTSARTPLTMARAPSSSMYSCSPRRLHTCGAAETDRPQTPVLGGRLGATTVRKAAEQNDRATEAKQGLATVPAWPSNLKPRSPHLRLVVQLERGPAVHPPLGLVARRLELLLEVQLLLLRHHGNLAAGEGEEGQHAVHARREGALRHGSADGRARTCVYKCVCVT